MEPARRPTDITTSGQGTPTVLVDVKVVNVVATVRDKHGKVISNLDRSDFTLEEDSHSVAIQYFSRESDLPLTLGLLVDTSMSQRTLIDQERSASKTFLERVLRDKDSAFLIHFDREVELLQDLTSSKQKLESELDSLQTRSRFDREDSSGPNSPDSRDDNSQRGGERGMRRGGTQLYDAIFLASEELLRKQQGRKALVVLSDGVDRGSKETLEGAIEATRNVLPPADHGERHPEDRDGARPAARGEDHGDVGEGKGEDRVLELDRVDDVRELQSP